MLASKQSANLASMNLTQSKEEFPVLRATLDEQQGDLQLVGSIDAVLSLNRLELGKLRRIKQDLARDMLGTKSTVQHHE